MFKVGDFVYFKSSDIYYFGRIIDINVSYISQYKIRPMYDAEGNSVELEDFYTNYVEDGHEEVEKRISKLMNKLDTYRKINGIETVKDYEVKNV